MERKINTQEIHNYHSCLLLIVHYSTRLSSPTTSLLSFSYTLYRYLFSLVSKCVKTEKKKAWKWVTILSYFAS